LICKVKLGWDRLVNVGLLLTTKSSLWTAAFQVSSPFPGIQALAVTAFWLVVVGSVVPLSPMPGKTGLYLLFLFLGG